MCTATTGRLGGQLFEVGAEAVALGVRVGEDTAQQHLIGAEADAAHQVGGAEGSLLDLYVEVLRDLVEGELADRDQRVVLLAPGLGEVEGVDLVVLSLSLRHDLHLEGPRRVVAILNVLVEVAAVEFGVSASQLVCFFLRQVANALVGLEVVLHPETLTLGVDPLIGVGGETIHFAERGGQAAVAEKPGYLVGGFGRQGPEVPAHLEGLQVGIRGALLGVDEVGELDGVTDEEHRGVVTNHVVVALLGVELEGETAGVTLGVSGTLFTGDGGEASQDGGLLSGLQEVCGGVGRDVFGDFENTEGAGTLGVDDTLGGAFTVEVSELVDEADIVEADVALLTLLERVVVGGDGSTSCGGGGGVVRGGAEAALDRVLVRHVEGLPSWNRIAV